MLFILFFLIVVAGAIGLTVRVVPEHERLVVYRLGRLRGALGPGVVLAPRGIDQVRRVTTKLVEVDVQVGDFVTLDGASPSVEVGVAFRVVDAEKAVVTVENYRVATAHAARATARAYLGEITIDRLLHDQRFLSERLTELINEESASWGVQVERVEIGDVGYEADSVRDALGVDEAAEFGDF